MVMIATEELPLDRVEQPRLRVVLDHWHAVRGQRAMPARRDIDPQGLRGALGIVMIARLDPVQDDFRFSLFGTEIAQAQRGDFTNKLARDLLPRDFGQAISDSYRQVRSTGRPYYGRLSLAIEREMVSYHRLVLPLGTADSMVDAVLVASEHEKSFWKSIHDAERDRLARTADR
jgi:hypothetical protein